MKIVTQKELTEFRDENTRDIAMPDGSKQSIRMTPLLWDKLEFLLAVEDGLTTSDLATYALEEMSLQDISFEIAFRCVVAHLANRWT